MRDVIIAIVLTYLFFAVTADCSLLDTQCVVHAAHLEIAK